MLPVNAFLIDHSEGRCLFDTGQSARAARPGYLPSWHPFLRLARFELGPEDEVARQLVGSGIDPASVRWVVLSHLHTDHVGGLAAFVHAEVLVSRKEWEQATGVRGRVRGYLPQHWPSGLEPRLIDFDGPAVGPFRASIDIAGDGRLILVPIPGHTPGHMGLLVRGATRSVFCAGDLARSAAELARVAPGLADFCRSEGITYLGAHDDRAPDLVVGDP